MYVKRLPIIFLSFAVIGLLVAGCTPGRAQTRKNAKNNTEIALDENNEDDSDTGNSRKKGVRESTRSSEEFDFNDNDSDGEENPYKKEKFYQTGNASWYGREFQGKRTASGEKFNMNTMSAAHKKLPMGSVVEVKNLDNGKTVRVRINDRGPYKDGRIIDLSYAAAKKLGMLSTGTAYVGIKVVSRDDKYADEGKKSSRKRDIEPVVDDDTEADVKNDRKGGDYRIQAGAFYSKRNAEKLKEKIEGLTENEVVVVHDGDLYKVRVEGMASKRAAEKSKKILTEKNIPAYLIEQGE